jgi:hypothetical protein
MIKSWKDLFVTLGLSLGMARCACRKSHRCCGC